jgi:hypothetical protein
MLYLVDEMSMVSIKIWAALAQMQMTGNRFFVFGDCKGQFMPIQDSHRTGLLEDVDHSSFMHGLCGGFRVEINKYRRGTDFAHYTFVGSLYGGDLQEALSRARETYPARGAAFEGTTLVVDHRCRVLINEQANRRQAGAQSVYLEIEAGPPTRGCANLPQHMFVWRGLVLIAVGTDKDLRNGLRYQMLELPGTENEHFSVQHIDDKGVLTAEPIVVDAKRLAKTLRLSHAFCYFSSQARTILGGLRLAQTNHPHFSIRHLIVGLGRAPEGSVVECE